MKTPYIVVIAFLGLLIILSIISYIIESGNLKKCSETESDFCPKYICPGEQKPILGTS